MDVLCAVVPRFLIALARRDNAALNRRPVIVGRSSETRGNVVACSEEVARTGVTPGMPLTRAMVLCPSAAAVALRQEKVEASERAFTTLLADHCPAVENIEPGHVHADVRGMAKLAGLAPSAYLAGHSPAAPACPCAQVGARRSLERTPPLVILPTQRDYSGLPMRWSCSEDSRSMSSRSLRRCCGDCASSGWNGSNRLVRCHRQLRRRSSDATVSSRSGGVQAVAGPLPRAGVRHGVRHRRGAGRQREVRLSARHRRAVLPLSYAFSAGACAQRHDFA